MASLPSKMIVPACIVAGMHMHATASNADALARDVAKTILQVIDFLLLFSCEPPKNQSGFPSSETRYGLVYTGTPHFSTFFLEDVRNSTRMASVPPEA